MLPRALLCRQAASHTLHTPLALRRAAATAVRMSRTVTDQRATPEPGVQRLDADRQRRVASQYIGRNSDRVDDVERRIWDLIRRGRFADAVAAAGGTYARRRTERQALAPITQFVLAKRQFSVECLYAGVFVLLEAMETAGPETQASALTLWVAALLGEQASGLTNLYYNQPAAQRALVDAMFSSSTAYYYVRTGNPARVPTSIQNLPRNLLPRLEWAAQNPEKLAEQMPRELRRRIDAAWMLRKPNSGFNDVEAAGAAVAELLRSVLVPDMPVVATLVSSAIRCQKPSVVMPIYATAQRPQGVPASAMMDLAILRALLGKKHPRIHYDVLGLLVRSSDLGNALLVVSSIRSRQMIHLLLSLWASQHPRDVRGISRIVRVALSTLDGQLLHSTHHLAISSILSSPHGRSSATMLVDRALAVHRVMAPRLESPSLAAVNQLMRAAMEQKMYSHVFAVYRDAESRPKWLQPGAQFANGAIMATLGECLARHLDMRSIATLTSVVTRSHIHAAPPFYTAIISGLVARPTKHDRHVLLRRVQVAEAILRTMGRCGIARPPKALYSIMYARAVLGQAWKTLRLFCRLDEKDVGEVAWGILMYAYVRRGDVRRTLEVLVRARKWLQTADVSVLRSKQMNTTSYLVNMAVSVLINSGNQDSALSLLDMCLARSSESIKELSATPGDPITLGLIVRALLASQRFMQAVHVYDDALDQFGVRETPGLLRLFLQHCLGRGDGSNALRIAQRVVQLAGTLSEHEWLLLIQYLEEDAEQVLTVYQMWCRQLGVDGVVRVPNAVIQDPELARRIHASLEWGGHVAEAAEFAYRWQQRSARQPRLAAGRPEPSGADPTCKQKLQLYRDLLREINQFPIPEMHKKLRHNARFIYELYRDLDRTDPRAHQLVQDGEFQLQWLRNWRALPPAKLDAVVHKPTVKIE